MEALANPEFLLPVTYIPLGLSQVTRSTYSGGIHMPRSHAKPLKYTRRERLFLSTQRLREFFRGRTFTSNLEANSDFIFYTASSKSHLQSRRVHGEAFTPSDGHMERSEEFHRPTSRRSCCFNLMDYLRILLACIWILMFAWTVVYSVVRCHQLDGCSYLLTTTEGFVVLAVLALTFVAGVAIVAILTTCKIKEEALFGEHNRVSNRVSLETQV